MVEIYDGINRCRQSIEDKGMKGYSQLFCTRTFPVFVVKCQKSTALTYEPFHLALQYATRAARTSALYRPWLSFNGKERTTSAIT